jgi:Holliday junction resolvase
MSAYTRGYLFEQKISGQLTQDGYWCIEARGSHGIADVVALKPGQVLLIQAKIDGIISIADWNRLLDLATRLGAVPLLAWRPKRGVIEYRRLVEARVARQPIVYEVWVPDVVVAGA